MKPAYIKIKTVPGKGKGLFVTQKISAGAVLFHFDGWIGDDAHTNAESLQVDENAFLESTMGYDDFLNHSCDPNCFVGWEGLNLIAKRDIAKGEELSYDYCTSDWDDGYLLQNHCFDCLCGSARCRGKVKGFRHLPHDEQEHIAPLLSPFLKKKWYVTQQ